MSTAPVLAPGGTAAKALPRHGRARWAPFALPALIALAAVNFLWQLGSSSYYVDEILSVNAAARPLGSVLHAVSTTELTPPGYFYFLHEWLYRLGSHGEWVARLPSAVCGALVVAAVYRLAWLLSARRTMALGAAALTAVSPFTLEYAQRAQGYVFVMLAVSVAVLAALEAERASYRRGRWLVAAALASALALWMHYTAGFVVLALCVWVATRSVFSVAQRRAFVGACVLAAVALLPVLLEQHRSIPTRTGVAASAGVTAINLERLVATPLDGRVDALRVLGAAISLIALLIVLLRRGGVLRERRLLLVLAVGEPLALLIASGFGAHLMLTRYAAVAAPFLIVVIAAAVAAVSVRSHALAALLAAGIAAVALAGSLQSHRRQGFYLDARSLVSYVRARARTTDAVLAPSDPGIAVPLIYYGVNQLHPVWSDQAAAAALFAAHRRRIWTIIELDTGDLAPAAVLAYAARLARPLGYRAVSAHVFPGLVSLGAVLEAPAAAGPASAPRN